MPAVTPGTGGQIYKLDIELAEVSLKESNYISGNYKNMIVVRSLAANSSRGKYEDQVLGESSTTGMAICKKVGIS